MIPYDQMDYHKEYLRTYWWTQCARPAALEAYEWKCHICGEEGGLQVHHRRYRDECGSVRGREDPYYDLMVLCQKHHRLYHVVERIALEVLNAA